MKVIFFAAILFTVNGLSEHEQWQSFKNEHGKSYGIVEERLRLQIFKDNLKKIEHHNARYEKGESKYYLGVTKFADLTEEEFSEWLRLQVPLKPKMKTSFREIPKNVVLPDAIDWREKGAVLEVKDQGACGSCWAFSVTGAVEGQNALVNNVTISLSEKQLMDCSRRYGNAACHGGIQIFGFDYVADFGLQSEDSYPYSVEETKCKYNESEVVVKIKERKQLNQTEVSLMEALVNVGPVSVSINADYLQLYEGGIYDDAKMCPNDRFLLNHAVLAVGYGVESDVQYWIVKNSWGANWGEKGYFKLHKNESICGILLDTSYPLLN